MLTILSCEKITGAEAIPHMRQKQREKLEARFWTKTETAPDGCLMWTGGTTGMGYGGFNIRGVMATAHRTALTLAKGPLPAGLLIRHRCHNPLCVNPEHLELGTHLDNSRDAIEAGRLPSGPGSRPRKLTPEDAVAILGAWMLGIPLKETAEMWDVAIITAAHIRMGRAWVKAIAKHMDEALGTPETPAVAP